MTFLEALREQVEVRKSRRGRWLLRRLERMRPARRERIVTKLEARAREYLSEKHRFTVGSSGWGAVGERDWDKFFDGLLKFLAALLPILLMFLSLTLFLMLLPFGIVT